MNLYVSSPAYTTGPSLAAATRYLSNTALWDGRRLLTGGEDRSGNPLYYSYVYGFSSMVRTANTAYSHQYHSTLWTQPSGRPCLAGGTLSEASCSRRSSASGRGMRPILAQP